MFCKVVLQIGDSKIEIDGSIDDNGDVVLQVNLAADTGRKLRLITSNNKPSDTSEKISDTKPAIKSKIGEYLFRKEQIRVLSMPITSSPLSGHTKRRLINIGIKTIGDLCERQTTSLPDNNLYRILSPNEIDTIVKMLQFKDLTLGMNVNECIKGFEELKKPEILSTHENKLTEKQLEQLSRHIASTPLNGHGKSALQKYGITFVWQLCQLNYVEREKIPKYGTESQLEMQRFCLYHNLSQEMNLNQVRDKLPK